MGEYIENLPSYIKWLGGIIFGAFVFSGKLIGKLFVENIGGKIELQIIKKLEEFRKEFHSQTNLIKEEITTIKKEIEKTKINISDLEKAIESQKRHYKKNRDQEILLLEQIIKKNDKNN